MATMKITIIDGVVIDGKDYFNGDVEVDVATAIHLISSGKAKIAESAPEVIVEPQPTNKKSKQ